MVWTPPPEMASLCARVEVSSTTRTGRGGIMNITTIGIDLAKSVFQIHGVEARGKAVLKRQLRRDQMGSFFANLPACLIGMEACASSHHWARKLQGLGHTVRLMAPQFVKPYVKTNKNDIADAEAICEAVGVEQQSVLSLHRVRQGLWQRRKQRDTTSTCVRPRVSPRLCSNTASGGCGRSGL